MIQIRIETFNNRFINVFTLFLETFGQFSRRRQRRDKVQQGMSPSGLISQTNADDWMLACRKMDRSLWITDYPPPSFHLVLRPTSFRRPQTAPFLPPPTARPSFSCSTSLPRRLSTSETSGREEKEKGPHSKAASTGNLPHAYVAACLSFLSSRFERSLRQRQPNPPRYSPAYRRSDAISMTGDVQALIRGVK